MSATDAALKFQVRSCLGKSRYESDDQARRYARKAMAARGGAIRPYYCRECCGFHLTKQPLQPAHRLPMPARA